MSTPATPNLATQLALVYPVLKPGTDYRLSNDGTRIVMWRSMVIDQPTADALLAAYNTAVATKAAADKITAAEAALDAFWGSLTPVQKKPLLGDYTAIEPLAKDTAAKLLLIVDIAATVTGLTDAQTALKNAAMTACAAIAA